MLFDVETFIYFNKEFLINLFLFQKNMNEPWNHITLNTKNSYENLMNVICKMIDFIKDKLNTIKG